MGTDIMDIDQAAHRLYAGDRTMNGVDVFDVSGPNAVYLKTIPLAGGAMGVVAAPYLEKVFVGNRAGLAVIDVNPQSSTADTVVATITTGNSGTDELDYDPRDQKVYVTDPGDHLVAAIDALGNRLIKTFENMPDGLEQPHYNPADGQFYESVRQANIVQQFDPTTDTLVSQTPIGDDCRPAGMAINPSRELALLGCQSQHTDFWDLQTGQVVASLDNDGSGDSAIYDAQADRFFFATSGFHRGPVIGIFGGDGTFLTNVPTSPSSHQVAYDEANQRVYTTGTTLLSFALPA